MKRRPLGLLVGSLLLSTALHAFGAEKDLTAEEVILRYLQAVQRNIGRDPQALGYEGAITRLHELGEEYLLKNKTILHKKAAADYLKLDELKILKIDSLKRIHWDSTDNYMKGKTITLPDPETNKTGSLIVMFIDGGYGIPPYSRHTLVTKWWNPLTAAEALREITLQALLPQAEFQKRMVMHGLVEPSVFRLNSNPEKPSIGFLDGKELLVIDLKYTDVGIYSMAGLRWVKLDDTEAANKADAGDGK